MAGYVVNWRFCIVYIIGQLTVTNFNKFKSQGRKSENKFYIKTADIYGITEYSYVDQSERECKFILNILLHNYIFYIFRNTKVILTVNSFK